MLTKKGFCKPDSHLASLEVLLQVAKGRSSELKADTQTLHKQANANVAITRVHGRFFCLG